MIPCFGDAMEVATNPDARSSDPVIVIAEGGVGSWDRVIVAADAEVICGNGGERRRVKMTQVQVTGAGTSQEAVATFANGGERRLKSNKRKSGEGRCGGLPETRQCQ